LGYSIINIDSWARKNAYLFYKDFDDPYFNFTVNVDITSLLKRCKTANESFFLNTIYLALSVANTIDNFKIRFNENELVIHDSIDGGSTLLYDDESFGFGYYNFDTDRETFILNAQKEIDYRKSTKSFEPNEDQGKNNLIYFSSVPWMTFTSTKHAQHNSINKSIPRITIGKYFNLKDQIMMPVNVEANHALMDGYHLGLFFERFEARSR